MKKSKFYDMDKKTTYYVNPDLSELDTIPSGIVRFIADDNTKQVYCWDGNVVLHDESLNIIHLSTDDYYKSLAGVAQKKAGKYVMIGSDFLEIEEPDEYEYDAIISVLSTDWSWVEDYNIQNVSNYMKDLKSEIRVREEIKFSNIYIAKKLITLAEDILKEK